MEEENCLEHSKYPSDESGSLANMSSGGVRQALAAEAWRLLFDFVAATAGHRDRVLEQLQLTPADVRTLAYLDADHGRTMTELADGWECDPSTATWLVDRVERRGFAERSPVRGDRRRKAVTLTPAGARIRSELMAGLYAPPPEMLELDAESLERLRDGLTAVARVTPPGMAPPTRAGTRST